MSFRKKCLRDGHKFRDHAAQGFPLPITFCARWRCSATAVTKWCPPEMAVHLHNAIPREDRVPPVELNDAGEVIESW